MCIGFSFTFSWSCFLSLLRCLFNNIKTCLFPRTRRFFCLLAVTDLWFYSTVIGNSLISILLNLLIFFFSYTGNGLSWYIFCEYFEKKACSAAYGGSVICKCQLSPGGWRSYWVLYFAYILFSSVSRLERVVDVSIMDLPISLWSSPL